MARGKRKVAPGIESKRRACRELEYNDSLFINDCYQSFGQTEYVRFLFKTAPREQFGRSLSS
jgi:hypothetical protein